MQINNREISRLHEPYVIAEIGAGHDGTLKGCKSLIDAAIGAGADAVKLQVYTPRSLTIDCDKPPFIVKGGTWDGRKIWDLYSKAATPMEWLPELFSDAKTKGYTLLATPFAPEDVDILEKLECPAYKIASLEIAHFDLLFEVARTGKPIFFSTGGARINEATEAHSRLEAHGSDVCPMHCTLGYPTPYWEANLQAIQILQRAFDPDLVGYSDHTLGLFASPLAVALGACAIEKHVAMPGTEDAGFGLRPWEFADHARMVRTAWKAVQPVEAQSEEPILRLKRSVYAVADIPEGEFLSEKNIAVIRPAGGAHPREYPLLLGRRALCHIRRGTPITEGELYLKVDK